MPKVISDDPCYAGRELREIVMGLFSALFGSKPEKRVTLPRKPSRAEAMKAWGEKTKPGSGNYVPKHKR